MTGIILLPTLNRVPLVDRFLRSYRGTNSSLPGLILTDQADFDEHKAKYEALDLPKDWQIKITKARSMGGKCQEVWDDYIDKDFVVLLNDDHILETNFWDKQIASQVKGYNILGTNDGWQAPRRLAGATVFSCEVLKTLGYMFPNGISHLFIDNVWEMLGSRAGCIQILMEVMVKHDHVFKTGKKDDTHEVVYPKDWENGEDAKRFREWQIKDFEKDALKLITLQPKTGLMIATPSHDNTCNFDYAIGLSDISVFLSQHNVHNELARVVGSSLIPHARNNLVDIFLKSKCQKMMFIDADQGFTKETVLNLFQSNRRIIGGVTPHKRFPINLNFDPLEKDLHFFKSRTDKSAEEFIRFINERADKVTGELEVEKTGTGLLMIDRSVFELMRDHVEKYKAFDSSENDFHYEFFKTGATDGEYHGEDWSFISLAKKLQIPIYINVRALATHQGHFSWRI